MEDEIIDKLNRITSMKYQDQFYDITSIKTTQDQIPKYVELAELLKQLYINKTSLHRRSVWYLLGIDESQLDFFLSKYSVYLKCWHEDLRIVADSRALMSGKIKIVTSITEVDYTDKILCLLPIQPILYIVDVLIDDSVRNLIIVEKVCFVHQIAHLLLQNRSLLNKTVFVATKGQPDRNLRGFLRKYGHLFEKVGFLGDYDCYGITIYNRLLESCPKLLLMSYPPRSIDLRVAVDQNELREGNKLADLYPTIIKDICANGKYYIDNCNLTQMIQTINNF